ncbi:MAG: hypothetical protein A2063_07500 [Gallionellales bacterium GWA2_60_142]|nr:MAG: hypothetical protein A2063_07500 [Gallionellales bacterium GWA2_60_142]HCI13602.1 hypothetical protein [Gallionellaceae bacterium]
MQHLGFLLWIVISVVEDIERNKRRKLFEADMELAVKNSQPSWEQLTAIASSRGLNNTVIFWSLQDTLREILTGRNSDLKPHQSVIEGYLSKLREIEPFEGIPNEIRLHLERVKELLPKGPDLLQPLTSQIRDLVSVNEKDRRQQKYYTVGGFFVGFVGLLFAAFTYFYPNSGSTPAQHSSVGVENSSPATAGSSLSNPSVQGTLRDKAAQRS